MAGWQRLLAVGGILRFRRFPTSRRFTEPIRFKELDLTRRGDVAAWDLMGEDSDLLGGGVAPDGELMGEGEEEENPAPPLKMTSSSGSGRSLRKGGGEDAPSRVLPQSSLVRARASSEDNRTLSARPAPTPPPTRPVTLMSSCDSK